MTIPTSAASSLVAGDGLTTTFQFSFVPDSASDITVTYIDSSGNYTVLTSTQYTILINPPASNQLWGVGFTITYPLTGSAIAAGTYLLVTRSIPLTQPTSVQNQGNYYAKVTEQALDTLCMQIQQVSARTGQMRGTWATGVDYNFGDVVVDGSNGNNTGNYYMCAIANTSGTWATDLAAGDWSLVINIQAINTVIGAYLPLIGGTITGNLVVNGTLRSNGVFNPAGGITASTVAGTALISGGVTNAKLAQVNANIIKGNNTNAAANVTDIAMGTNTFLARSTGNISAITIGAALSLATGKLNTTAPNIYQNTVSAPAATTNLTGVMMGLASTITTNNSGVVQMLVSGHGTNSGAPTDTGKVQIRYGTGTAPANGAALSGITAGGLVTFTPSNNGLLIPFALNANVANLGAGSAYWVDISLAAGVGGSASVGQVTTSLYELK